MHLYYLAVNLDRVKLFIFAHIASNDTQVSKNGVVSSLWVKSGYSLHFPSVFLHQWLQSTSVRYRPDKKLACTVAMTTFVDEDPAVLQPIGTTKIMWTPTTNKYWNWREGGQLPFSPFLSLESSPYGEVGSDDLEKSSFDLVFLFEIKKKTIFSCTAWQYHSWWNYCVLPRTRF